MMEEMHVPISTYRIQLNSAFPFEKLKGIIPYLKKMGISTVYSAPFFSATPGSAHGYDGTNPEMINHEIGSLEQFIEIKNLLKSNDMGWLQDIVPNHMAFDPHNEWLMDIFEKGKHSDYLSFFDIDWQHPHADLKGRVLAPFLGEPLEDLIKKGEVRISFHQTGFCVEYGHLLFPLHWASYYDIVARFQVPAPFQETLKHLQDDLLLVKNNFEAPSIVNTVPHLKEALFDFYISDPEVKECMDNQLDRFKEEVDFFLSLLRLQVFQLAHYCMSDTLINYRRFFVINQLICLKIEEEHVFAHFHRFIKGLLDLGLIDGLRVDHIDGLYHPKQYLEKLRKLAGEERYLIVEKILASEENLPNNWPVQGSSGYEFLRVVNNLFTKRENRAQFCQIYQDFTGFDTDFEELVQQKKAYMLKKRMGGEQDNLLSLFVGCQLEGTQVWHKERLKEALFQVLISFPVYRSYVDPDFFSEIDQAIWRNAFQSARSKKPELIEELLLLETALSKEGMQNESNLKFMMRLQQFTGPLAAKGVEDTVFYVHNCLISHNEVGDSSNSFGISTEEFHVEMKKRRELIPFSLNALSTHDTKRGEDARARINALAEMPEEWAREVFGWKERNRSHKVIYGEKEMPDPNDEYFIYQSLIGGLPMDGEVTEEFKKRIKEFMLKALREAKVYTDYPDYNTEYEAATLQFLDRILADPDFSSVFRPFFQRVSDAGILISLAQTVVKNTAPGVPDTYQGSELWELSFVDPDNRREIDFDKRAQWLEEMSEQTDTSKLLQDMLENKRDGRIKLYVTWKSLNERLLNASLFKEGDYVPLTFSGKMKEALVGFGRYLQGQWVLTIVPREGIPSDDGWMDTSLVLPETNSSRWYHVFTGETYESNSTISMQDLFALFPVALLKNSER